MTGTVARTEDEEMVTIKSHWNAVANALNGRECESVEAALRLLRQPRWLGPDAVSVPCDDGSTLVYLDQESADRDRDGSRCHAAIEVQS